MFLDVKTIIVTLILTRLLMILAQTGAYAGKFHDDICPECTAKQYLYLKLGEIAGRSAD
jgi:hypothetical protein